MDTAESDSRVSLTTWNRHWNVFFCQTWNFFQIFLPMTHGTKWIWIAIKKTRAENWETSLIICQWYRGGFFLVRSGNYVWKYFSVHQIKSALLPWKLWISSEVETMFENTLVFISVSALYFPDNYEYLAKTKLCLNIL